MPSEIHLIRYNKNLTEIPISDKDWKTCEKQVGGLKLVNDEEGQLNRVECYCKALNDWIPVFWIHSTGSGFMRESGFFKYEESYEKAIEIGVHFKAIIHADEGQILFEPNIGVLFDDCEPYEQPTITLDELSERKVYFQKDVKKAIQDLIKEKEENLNNNPDSNFENQIPLIRKITNKRLRLEQEKKWWEFWK